MFELHALWPTQFPHPHPLSPSHGQVIKRTLRETDDTTTQLALLYANQTPEDILLREELDQLAAEHPNFKVWYTGKAGGEGGGSAAVERYARALKGGEACVTASIFPQSANRSCNACPDRHAEPSIPNTQALSSCSQPPSCLQSTACLMAWSGLSAQATSASR
jgi:hypothetical protein